MHTPNKFTLYGGNDAFADRQKKLFDELSIAEKQCNSGRSINTAAVPMDIEPLNADEERQPLRSSKKRKSEMRQFRGKESIFKRPEGPAPRNNSHSIPDHHRNPHKWMKYSLDDVCTDDMTDRSNARTAFAFLNELKARRAKEARKSTEDIDSPVESGSRDNVLISENHSCKQSGIATSIRFKKPKVDASNDRQNSAVIVTPEERPTFLSTKVLMPEYVVGQKQKQKKKKKKDKEKRDTWPGKVDRTKELKLNHLEEIDDGEENI